MSGVRCRPDGMSFARRIASFQQSRCILAAFPTCVFVSGAW
jgi:hypothetical protein